MPEQHWSEERWVQNADGSYRRRTVADKPLEDEMADYASMTKAELVYELESRSLSKSGSKAELVARLEAE